MVCVEQFISFFLFTLFSGLALLYMIILKITLKQNHRRDWQGFKSIKTTPGLLRGTVFVESVYRGMAGQVLFEFQAQIKEPCALSSLPSPPPIYFSISPA